MNFPHGFHLGIATFLVKSDAVPLLKSFYHFAANENPTGVHYTHSNTGWLPVTDVIYTWEDILSWA